MMFTGGTCSRSTVTTSSPSLSGITRSVITRSAPACGNRSRPSAPLRASITVWPASSRASRSTLRTESLSSMRRMRAMTLLSGILLAAPFDALAHCVDENGHVDGLIQHVIGAGGQRGGDNVDVAGARHHHNWHVSPVTKRANSRDQLHATHAMQSIVHKHRVVRSTASERVDRAPAGI